MKKHGTCLYKLFKEHASSTPDWKLSSQCVQCFPQSLEDERSQAPEFGRVCVLLHRCKAGKAHSRCSFA